MTVCPPTRNAAGEREVPMFYELRHHDACSSRSLDVLNSQFGRVLPIWQRLGIESVGFWPVLVGPYSPRLTSIIAWESLEQRERLWDAFLADEEYLDIVQHQANDPTRLFTNALLRPIPGSPMARHDNQPPRLAGGTFELRIMTFEEQAKLRAAATWYAETGLGQARKHGMFVMGIWETYIGVSPQITYMLVFENLAHRERAWASFYTDPVWPRLQDALYPGGNSLIHHTESSIMRGSEFSNWR